ncbi:MAG: ThiF family adenylyltransferase, partial [Proteobacteria bacterium]|nr:ThiF family adenylyltransferase [Pseudomonadota bacterium]
IIRHHPKTLKDIHYFAKSAGIDLLGELRRRVFEWHNDIRHPNLYSARLAIVLVLPKTRGEAGTVESLEEVGFLTVSSVMEIGKDIGRLETKDGHPAALVPMALEREGGETTVIQVTVMQAFSREMAAAQNGDPKPSDRKITAVGMGAFGSQLFLSLARAGYGDWTLVDDDILLPHNLARHALTGGALGYGKADALSVIANMMFNGQTIAKPLFANAINPDEGMAEPLRQAFEESGVILDLSASISAARHLARDVVSKARRISLFMNPIGTDLVMLAEDDKRSITLDCLEMQYYRYIIQTPSLEDHLRRPPGRIRYGNSCRDINSKLPEDLVALHASIACRALRNTEKDTNASIFIWRVDRVTGEVKRHQVPVEKTVEIKAGRWTLYSDQHLVEKIKEAREKLVPKETGGVLLGSIDT